MTPLSIRLCLRGARFLHQKYFAPSASEFMINYAVDDMDALLQRLSAKGVEIIKRDDTDVNGRFAWILDPEGNKIELWQPKFVVDTK